MAMDVNTLRHGLRGMQDAIVQDSSIGRADCALPFAIRILQELIVACSAAPNTVQFEDVSSPSNGSDANGNQATIKREPQVAMRNQATESPTLAVGATEAGASLASREDRSTTSHQQHQPAISAAVNSAALRVAKGVAPATATETASEDKPTGDTCPVTSWLQSAGLGEHASKFAEERIDMLSLGMLSEADLRDLGLPLGHRRRFQAYVEMMTG